jgi:Mg/Co/Ni transporter MgtE
VISAWKANLATRYLRNADPEEMLALFYKLLPTVIDRLSPQQRAAFLQDLVDKHLGDLLEGLSQEERARLMAALFPAFVREFSLTDVDLLVLLERVQA